MANLERWAKEIAKSRGGWVTMYVEALTAPISDPIRFFKALGVYGEAPMFEAIIISSTKNLKGDPLRYVLTVAHSLAQKEITKQRESDKYAFRLEQERETTKATNKELSDKIKRAKEITIE